MTKTMKLGANADASENTAENPIQTIKGNLLPFLSLKTPNAPPPINPTMDVQNGNQANVCLSIDHNEATDSTLKTTSNSSEHVAR